MNYVETKAVVKRKGKEAEETLSFSHSKDNTRNKKEKKKKKMNMSQNERNRSKRYPLLCFWELPEYMKDNEYILRYYRANWPLKQALFSVFRWHNETLNVWT